MWCIYFLLQPYRVSPTIYISVFAFLSAHYITKREMKKLGDGGGNEVKNLTKITIKKRKAKKKLTRA